jgi:zinc protease
MFVTLMQSAGERADKLSMYATYFGDPSLVNEQVERYRAVTPEQVAAFARDRLGEDNRASLLYVPAPRPSMVSEGRPVAAEVAS